MMQRARAASRAERTTLISVISPTTALSQRERRSPNDLKLLVPGPADDKTRWRFRKRCSSALHHSDRRAGTEKPPGLDRKKPPAGTPANRCRTLIVAVQNTPAPSPRIVSNLLSAS